MAKTDSQNKDKNQALLLFKKNRFVAQSTLNQP